MNHVSVSPTDGNGPTQGQRKTPTRVGTADHFVESRLLFVTREIHPKTFRGFEKWRHTTTEMSRQTQWKPLVFDY